MVESTLGSTAFAVIPCRDFARIFADPALIQRPGSVVVREREESSYPITTEVLSISDSWIRAIDNFPVVP